MAALKRPENRNTRARREQREKRERSNQQDQDLEGQDRPLTEPDVHSDGPVDPAKYEFTEGSGNISAHMQKMEAAGWVLVSSHIDPSRSTRHIGRYWVFCWRNPNVD